ncbi:hypothetical protein FB451DRAFT_792815 [Mycena latifolia]|nr:hypothetical protein FB451DRAFT_792815 [Mycena latifolia]
MRRESATLVRARRLPAPADARGACALYGPRYRTRSIRGAPCIFPRAGKTPSPARSTTHDARASGAFASALSRCPPYVASRALRSLNAPVLCTPAPQRTPLASRIFVSWALAVWSRSLLLIHLRRGLDRAFALACDGTFYVEATARAPSSSATSSRGTRRAGERPRRSPCAALSLSSRARSPRSRPTAPARPCAGLNDMH